MENVVTRQKFLLTQRGLGRTACGRIYYSHFLCLTPEGLGVGRSRSRQDTRREKQGRCQGWWRWRGRPSGLLLQPCLGSPASRVKIGGLISWSHNIPVLGGLYFDLMVEGLYPQGPQDWQPLCQKARFPLVWEVPGEKAPPRSGTFNPRASSSWRHPPPPFFAKESGIQLPRQLFCNATYSVTCNSFDY